MLKRIWEQLPPVTRNILALSTIMWMSCLLIGKMGYDMSNLLGLVNWDWRAFSFRDNCIMPDGSRVSRSFHLWQPFTYMLMHANFTHLFCNMLAVWMFGSVVEREWGSKRYLIYYIVCGAGAALVQELVWHFTAHGAPAITIGASGAVFGILLAFAWLFPEQRMFLLFIPIPIPARIFVGIYAAFELFAGVADFSGDVVAHFAHLGGMIFGCLLILFWKWWDKRPQNRFKTYQDQDYSNYHYKDPL